MEIHLSGGGSAAGDGFILSADKPAGGRSSQAA